MNLSIESPAFNHNNLIPIRYTCDSMNTPPPLQWQDDSPNTISYVLIMEDPDAPAGTWVHWILFNIPAGTTQLTESAPLPTGTISAKNSWGVTGYGGPCPPSGSHRYIFKLYALDTLLNLDARASKQEVEEAMKDHIISRSELVGLYQRQRP